MYCTKKVDKTPEIYVQFELVFSEIAAKDI